jgi:ABC-2 type transport system permease protein
MKNIALIAGRELAGYLRSPSGFVIAAAVLLIDGLMFNSYAVGSGAKLSAKVLQDFFYVASGTTMIASVLLSMRLVAEERQSGTISLLFTSPVRESEIIIGKYLSALIFLTGITVLTIYLPGLIFVHGKVSLGHIGAGYLGLVLLGGATLSLGVLGSTLARSQMVAGVLSATFIVALLLCWLLAKIADPPVKSVLSYLALFDQHFRPLQRGLLRVSDVLFFLSVVYFSLLASIRVLQSQRWQ